MREVAQIFDVPLVEDEYNPRKWREAVRGHENDPEGGERCGLCFHFRLTRAVNYAISEGFQAITTSLSISPHKKFTVLSEIGMALTRGKSVQFLPLNFKKQDGFRTSCEMSEEFGFYRQNYCGCVYSRRDDQENK